MTELWTLPKRVATVENKINPEMRDSGGEWQPDVEGIGVGGAGVRDAHKSCIWCAGVRTL